MSTKKERRGVVPWSFWLAVGLGVAFGTLHVSGLRDWVSVLSGTPVDGVPRQVAAVGGALYVAAWFGAVLVAPIFAIAAALRTLLGDAAADRLPGGR